MFTPLVIASVIANVTTRAIFQSMLGERYDAIFAVPQGITSGFGSGGMLAWGQLPHFAVLGVTCGAIAASLTVLMIQAEKRVAAWRTPKLLRPAIGGAAVGALGVVFVIVIGWWMLGMAKPFSFEHYKMPAFFGDGYGVVQDLLDPQYYSRTSPNQLIILLVALCGLKLVATCLTLGTGGSGGIIAPSLFLGAATGAALGLILQKVGVLTQVFPAVYALVGMGAVLGAVVHAPLAAILILLELTSDYHIVLPAMLATIVATGVARFIYAESVYTVAVKAHGIKLGSARDLMMLRRIAIEQVGLQPALVFGREMPLAQLVKAMGDEVRDAVIVDEEGATMACCGMKTLRLHCLTPIHCRCW